MTISAGTVAFGGVDSGSQINPGHDGTGKYQLDFTFGVNASADGTGWVVNPPRALNTGTISALDRVNGNDNVADFSFNLFESEGMNHFKFLQDEHRLSGHPQAEQGYWVGRGWLAFDPSINSPDTQDFLFIAKEVEMVSVPLPTPVALGFAGVDPEPTVGSVFMI